MKYETLKYPAFYSFHWKLPAPFDYDLYLDSNDNRGRGHPLSFCSLFVSKEKLTSTGAVHGGFFNQKLEQMGGQIIKAFRCLVFISLVWIKLTNCKKKFQEYPLLVSFRKRSYVLNFSKSYQQRDM